MKAFKCSKCGNTSYSSADIEQQKNTRCPCCGADMRKCASQMPEPIKEIMRRVRSPDEDICVMCGSTILEGRMVCAECEADHNHAINKNNV